MSTTSIAAEPLSRADAAWLRMERTTNPMTVTALMLFDAPLDFDRLRAALEERLLLHPRFRRRVVEHLLGLAAPRWEDDSRFDIRGHLHRVALPPPGDDAALRALVSDLMSERLDLARPPWQTHLIEGVGRGCAVLTRVHHCVGDGYALVRILLSMADPIPAPDPGLARRTLP
jgi:WS/DGAT/MGAT family acyltransferase